MSAKLANATRADMFRISPRFIAGNEDWNSRKFITDDRFESGLVELAMSLMEGQEQTIVLAKNESAATGTYKLIEGFRRWRAGLLIVNGFVGPDGNEYREENFTLKATLTTCTDREAMLRNVTENLQRLDFSVIEMAHICRHWSEHFGLTQAEIAAKIPSSRNGHSKVSQGWVSQVIKLCALPEDVQKAIHFGQMTVAEGQARLKSGDTVVSETPLLPGMESPDSLESGLPKPKLKDVKTFVTGYAGGTALSPSAKAVFQTFEDYLNGVIDEQYCVDAIEATLEAERGETTTHQASVDRQEAIFTGYPGDE